MRRFRSTIPEPRLDLTPLLDVVFLLLTFFALTLVLLVRAELLDVTLPAAGSGEGAADGTLVTLAVLSDGSIALDGEPDELVGIAERVLQRLADKPDAQLVLAVDVNAPSGKLIELVQTLRAGGIERFGVLGQGQGGADGAGGASDGGSVGGGGGGGG